MAEGLLENFDYPWEALGHISDFILQLGPSLPQEKYDRPKADVWIAKSAKVMDSACIAGPCIIGENTEVRHCAFIRGKALIGDNCVVGNSSELKNVILFKIGKIEFEYVYKEIDRLKQEINKIKRFRKKDFKNQMLNLSDYSIGYSMRSL